MVCIQIFLEEISNFSFNIEHISGKHIFVSDFLSHFSSDNQDEEPIPYLTDTSCLDNASYMSYLDSMCAFNYATNQGICTKHSFPLTRSQAKLQKIAITSLFKGGTMVSGPKQRPPSLLRDPPSVLAGKRSTALPPADLGTIAPKKRGRVSPFCIGLNNLHLSSLMRNQMT